MRLTKRAVLVAAAACAAVAVMAPTASATGGSVTVKDMAGGGGGTPCPAVSKSGTTVTGGCAISYASSGLLEYRMHMGDAYNQHAHSCYQKFTARIDSSGNGWATGVVNSGSQPCPFMAGCNTPWKIQLHSNGDGTFHAHAYHCVSSPFFGQMAGEHVAKVASNLTIETTDGRLMPGQQTGSGWAGFSVHGVWTVQTGSYQLS
jgi:hypothetical protein